MKLEIPLDGTHSLSAKAAAEDSVESKPLRISDGVDKGARELVRRDSLKRREALLKGKEGSRRRQRWENGACQLSIDACTLREAAKRLRFNATQNYLFTNDTSP